MNNCNSNKTQTGLSALGGALLGAVAMYLLDPESGKRRRHHIADVAEDKFGSAALAAKVAAAALAERAGDVSAVVSDKAHDWATNLSSGVSDRAEDVRDWGAGLAAAASLENLRDRAGGLGHTLLDKVRHLGATATGAAGDWADDVSHRASRMSHPARHRLARTIDPDHVRGSGHAVGWSATGVGTLLIGAGVMYFLDPERGRSRRAWAGQKLTKIVNDTGTAARRTGRDLANRARGTVAQTQGQVRRATSGGEDADGEQLLQRIRSKMGHVLTYPTHVQLMADAGGTVTLYGQVPQHEEDRLLATIHAVAGVRQIINRLEVRPSGVSMGANGGGSAGDPATGSTGVGQAVPQM